MRLKKSHRRHKFQGPTMHRVNESPVTDGTCTVRTIPRRGHHQPATERGGKVFRPVTRVSSEGSGPSIRQATLPSCRLQDFLAAARVAELFAGLALAAILLAGFVTFVVVLVAFFAPFFFDL